MGIRDRKEREKEARRQAILDAARDVFSQDGFQAATMDQIAEAAELGKGTLYLYFPSKHDLFITLFLEGLEILYGMLSEAARKGKNWETLLKDTGMAYYRFYLEHPFYFRILFLWRHGEMASSISQELYLKCLEKGRACLRIISGVIDRGKEAGDIVHPDSMELAVVLWGFLNGTLLLYEEKEHEQLIPSTLDRILEVSFELIIDGLKRRSP